MLNSLELETAKYVYFNLTRKFLFMETYFWMGLFEIQNFSPLLLETPLAYNQ